MGNSNVLFESVFKRKLSDAGTREYLTEITNEHPYFSPAQFFLLLETEKGTSEYQLQAAKTSVLFNNPWWLQFQLQEHKLAADETLETTMDGDKQLIVTENETVFTTGTLELNESADDIITSNSDNPVAEELTTVINESPNGAVAQHSKQEIPAIDIPEEKVPEPIIPETILLDSSGTLKEIGTENKTPEVIIENIVEPHKNNVDEIIVPHEDEITGSISTGHFNNDNSPLVNETETEEGVVTDEEIEPLNFKLNIDTSNTTEDTITFEPLHTSDYFASLGIKLSGEIPASDKLGKQLKSFTEWLKTMKKIHGGQLPRQSGQADLYIQELAEQSNKEDAVLTEAMADVLLQQGKADKAIELYKKLSLLNPSKSAFFAAKIDQLKEH